MLLSCWMNSGSTPKFHCMIINCDTGHWILTFSARSRDVVAAPEKKEKVKVDQFGLFVGLAFHINNSIGLDNDVRWHVGKMRPLVVISSSRKSGRRGHNFLSNLHMRRPTVKIQRNESWLKLPRLGILLSSTRSDGLNFLI